jgi:hypothetical protein
MADFCRYPERVEGYRAFATMPAAQAYARSDEFIRGWQVGFIDTIAGAYPSADMISEAEWLAKNGS